MVQNKGLIFKKVPSGWPKPGEDLAIETREIDLEGADVPQGGLLIKNHYLSFDPYQRGRMRAPEIKSYSPPFELGKPITNRGISTVVVSKSDKFKKGDVIVSGDSTGTEEYTIWDDGPTGRAQKLHNPHNLDPVNFIGPLGMPGLTAYSSLYEIGKPQKGETIWVSAASGAVGQLVGQIAKHEGLKVIGSVGDDAKLDFIINELGFDGGFNYKKEKPRDALKRLAPDGIDIYYENVGGEQLEVALDVIKPFGRIIACGMISQYNSKPEERYGIPNLINVVGKRLTIRGFIVGDKNMGPVYYKEFNEKVSAWIADGSFKVKLDITKGIDGGAEAFIGMLSGKNFGKAVLEIAPLDTQ